MPAADWAAARAAMLLDPDVINLNTGSFGPTPRPVFERVTELRQQLAAEPMDFLVRKLPPLLWAARTRARRVPRHTEAEAARLHAERHRRRQPRRVIAAAGRARRDPADRPRVRGDALVLGAGRPATGADAAHLPAADRWPKTPPPSSRPPPPP